MSTVTKNVIDGSDILLFAYTGSGVAPEVTEYTPIGFGTSHTLTMTMDTREVASAKNSGKYKVRRPGKLDVNGSFDGLAVYPVSSSFNYASLLSVIDNRTKVRFIFGEKDADEDTAGVKSGSFYASGSFYITNIDVSSPNEDDQTYAGSFELADDFGLFNTIG